MLLVVGKGIRGRICHTIYEYGKVSNKYMKYYDKKKEPSCLNYLDVNNLYRWAIHKSCPYTVLSGLKIHLNLENILMKTSMKIVMKDIFFETNVQYLEKLLDIYNDLHFSHESIKIETVGKHVTNLHDKKEYGVHIRNLKETLNNGLVLKKVHSVIKFNQKAWLKSYIDMNSELKKMQMILKTFSR